MTAQHLGNPRNWQAWRFRFTATLLVTLVIPLGVHLSVFGQVVSTATITGSVVDSDGAVIPGAKIVVTNSGTEVKTTVASNGSGSFNVTGLSVGTYSVNISHAGFNTYEITDMYLGPAQTRAIPAVLKVGRVETEIQVSADVQQVQTTTSEISGNVTQKQVENIPLNGRNYQGLASLMPGVANLNAGQQLGTGGFATYNAMSVNGMGTAGTVYLIDGIWNMNSGWMIQTSIVPNPDQIQEVRVLQNNYSVKYGLMGTSVVIVQTKAGGSTFHGGGWEFLRNNALDARNFFNPTLSALHQNIFGYHLGGPVPVPGLKKKLFFYWNQQWVRQNKGSTITSVTISQAERGGNFPASLNGGAVYIKDPQTGQQFPNNQIPPGRFSPDSLALVNALFPLENNPNAGFNNYINTNSSILRQRDDEIRADYDLTPKFRLMGEYLDERQNSLSPNQSYLNSPYSTNQNLFTTPNQLAQIGLTQQYSSNIVNQSRVTVNSYLTSIDIQGVALRSQVPGFQSSTIYKAGGSQYLPLIAFVGGFPPTGVFSASFLPHSHDLDQSFADDLSWFVRKHAISAGVQLPHSTVHQYFNASTNGISQFSGYATTGTGHPFTAYNAIADLLLGYPIIYQEQSFKPRWDLSVWVTSWYVEDQWKAARRLTLTLGFRANRMPLMNAARGMSPFFDPTRFNSANAPTVTSGGVIVPTPTYDPLNGVLFNGENGVPLNAATPKQWYWLPSFGFAWDVLGDGKTAIRGGYGITTARSNNVSGCNLCIANYPIISTKTLVLPSWPNPTSGVVPAATVGTYYTRDPQLQAAQIQTYSLSVEHELPGNWFFAIAGAGNLAHHLADRFNINQPPPDPPYDFNPNINNPAYSPYSFSPYQGYGGILSTNSEDVSYWTGLLANVRHDFSHGLFFNASYTWAHGLSNNRSTSPFQYAATMQNPFKRRTDYGNSALNIPQIFTFNIMYDLPFFSRASGWKRTLLGGWKYTDITTMETGSSQDLALGTPNAGLATRPNLLAPIQLVKRVNPTTGVNQWFNPDPSRFSAPAAGYYGNSPVGNILGPGVVNFDMAFYKDFLVHEQHTIQFRWEAFNVFNHTNFLAIDKTYGSGTFGHVLSARDPRIMEAGIRYTF